MRNKNPENHLSWTRVENITTVALYCLDTSLSLFNIIIIRITNYKILFKCSLIVLPNLVIGSWNSKFYVIKSSSVISFFSLTTFLYDSQFFFANIIIFRIFFLRTFTYVVYSLNIISKQIQYHDNLIQQNTLYII